jgi:peptidoglycan/LPS O-acetylase OafA/YrhL
MQRADISMVQALRAAACLLVVAYHTLQAGAGEAAIRAWPNGSAGVDLFFIISGYVMVVSTATLRRRPHPGRTFLRRRLRRIAPLYWLLTLGKLAVTTLAPAATPHTNPTAWNIVASLLFIPSRDAAGLVRPPLPVGWTLNFEFFFYALFALTLAWRVPPLALTPVLAAAALAGFFRTAAWPAPLMLANGMVLEFAAGMALATFPPRLPPRAALWLLPAAAALLLAVPLTGPWRFLTWGVPAAGLLAAARALEPSLGPRLPRALLAIGDASYAIYLVHPFLVPAIAPHGTLGALAAVPLSVAAGLLVHRYVDAPLQAGLVLR